MGRACSLHGEEEKFLHDLVGKREWRRLIRRRKSWWGIILKWVVLSRLEDCRSALFTWRQRQVGSCSEFRTEPLPSPECSLPYRCTAVDNEQHSVSKFVQVTKNRTAKRIRIASTNCSAILELHFNFLDYHTHSQEYGVNFFIYFCVLC